jgi:DNA polymerase-4
MTTLTDFAQDDLFSTASPAEPAVGPAAPEHDETRPLPPVEQATTHWRPGQDVHHDEYGPGWVWGSGRGRVTIRFEGPATAPGPVRTFSAEDPSLHPAEPPDWRSPA